MRLVLKGLAWTTLAAVSGWTGAAAQAAEVGPAVVGDPVVLAESDGRSRSDQFGSAVAVGGDLLVVGAAEDQTVGGPNHPGGAAYIYERSDSEWILQAKVLPRAGVNAADFGDDVAISGETIFVSSPFENRGDEAQVGSVYIFERVDGRWARTGLLSSPDPRSTDRFGGSLVTDGDTLVARDHWQREEGDWFASVDVFVRTDAGWVLQSEIRGPHPRGYEEFGNSLALDGDTLLVGAIRADAVSSNSGAVYVYSRDGATWQPTAKLSEPGLPRYSYFGQAVEIDGDTAAVSTSDFERDDKTSVFVYVRSGPQWAREATIVAPLADRAFGREIGLDGDALLIGSPSYGPQPVRRYQRVGQSWALRGEVFSPDPEPRDDLYGSAIAVGDETVAIADVYDDDGKVYLYGR